jgi:hypothetical protein
MRVVSSGLKLTPALGANFAPSVYFTVRQVRAAA